MRVIYALGSPKPDAENDLFYHGASNRGSRSLLLLSHYEETALPNDAWQLDVRVNNVGLKKIKYMSYWLSITLLKHAALNGYSYVLFAYIKRGPE